MEVANESLERKALTVRKRFFYFTLRKIIKSSGRFLVCSSHCTVYLPSALVRHDVYGRSSSERSRCSNRSILCVGPVRIFPITSIKRPAGRFVTALKPKKYNYNIFASERVAASNRCGAGGRTCYGRNSC